MDLLKIEQYVHTALNNNQKRLKHTKGVVKIASQLAKINREDIAKAQAAAWLHDVCKLMSIEEINNLVSRKFSDKDLIGVPKECLHAYAAAALAMIKFNIVDEDVIHAITYHCTGRDKMSLLEKIVYVSDYIEESRTFVSEDLRELTYKSIDLALIRILKETIDHLERNNKCISIYTFKAYHYYKKMEVVNERTLN